MFPECHHDCTQQYRVPKERIYSSECCRYVAENTIPYGHLGEYHLFLREYLPTGADSFCRDTVIGDADLVHDPPLYQCTVLPDRDPCASPGRRFDYGDRSFEGNA